MNFYFKRTVMRLYPESDNTQFSIQSIIQQILCFIKVKYLLFFAGFHLNGWIMGKSLYGALEKITLQNTLPFLSRESRCRINKIESHLNFCILRYVSIYLHLKFIFLNSQQDSILFIVAVGPVMDTIP